MKNSLNQHQTVTLLIGKGPVLLNMYFLAPKFGICEYSRNQFQMEKCFICSKEFRIKLNTIKKL